MKSFQLVVLLVPMNYLEGHALLTPSPFKGQNLIWYQQYVEKTEASIVIYRSYIIPLISMKLYQNILLISVYIDIGPPNNEDSGLSLIFTFTGRAIRRWQIKNTFVQCFSASR